MSLLSLLISVLISVQSYIIKVIHWLKGLVCYPSASVLKSTGHHDNGQEDSLENGVGVQIHTHHVRRRVVQVEVAGVDAHDEGHGRAQHICHPQRAQGDVGAVPAQGKRHLTGNTWQSEMGKSVGDSFWHIIQTSLLRITGLYSDLYSQNFWVCFHHVKKKKKKCPPVILSFCFCLGIKKKKINCSFFSHNFNFFSGILSFSLCHVIIKKINCTFFPHNF